MKKRILLCIVFVFTIVLIYAYAGEVKLTTYYPAPYGEYKKMVAKTLGVGDNDGSGVINSGDAPDPATNPGDVWIKGNVGIGTTTPAGALDVRGGAAAASTNGTSLNFYAQDGGTGNTNGGNIILMPGAPSGTGANGNVGIGTTNPSYKLHTYSTDGDYAAKIQNQRGDTTGHGLWVDTRWDVADNYVLRLTTNTGTENILAAKGNGNVGIGTTTPAQRLEVAGITRLGVSGSTTKAAEIYMSSGASNWGGNKFLLRFPSTIATSANDEMWIGIGGGSGSLRGGYVGHIQLVAENLHFNTSNDSGPVGSRDGLTTLTGGVMIMANESGLMVPRNTNAVTKPLRSGTLNGTIYYNTSTNKFQGCENGIWKNLGGGGGGMVSGSYTGAGSSLKITLSPAFRPNLVMIINNRPCEFIKMSSMSGQTAFTQGAGIVGEGQAQYGNYVRIEDDGFTVYGNANKSGQTHYYVACP